MSYFSSDDAFEAADAGEPIMLGAAAARKILLDHGSDLADFADDADFGHFAGDRIAADRLLAFLGY